MLAAEKLDDLVEVVKHLAAEKAAVYPYGPRIVVVTGNGLAPEMRHRCDQLEQELRSVWLGGNWYRYLHQEIAERLARLKEGDPEVRRLCDALTWVDQVTVV